MYFWETCLCYIHQKDKLPPNRLVMARVVTLIQSIRTPTNCSMEWAWSESIRTHIHSSMKRAVTFKVKSISAHTNSCMERAATSFASITASTHSGTQGRRHVWPWWDSYECVKNTNTITHLRCKNVFFCSGWHDRLGLLGTRLICTSFGGIFNVGSL